MGDRIYLSSPHMCGSELRFVHEAFDTNWVAPLGKNVDEFEHAVEKFIGRPYAVALSSGTAAIHLGLKALGVKAGDIVFCSSLTFSASANPIRYLGAEPVFIDSETDTWNMCPKALQLAYKKYPNPKAVVVVNIYGNPAQFDEIKAITTKHNTPILEDAAESLGASYKGVQTGNFGDVSIFSFNGNKIITTSGGGMALTKTKQMRDKILFWATQSREQAAWYQHSELGYNYRLSNICAGIGRGQMTALALRVKRKTDIYSLYKNCFEGNNFISMMPIAKDTVPNFWLSVIQIDSGCKKGFLDVIAALESVSIEARPVWKPMHLQSYYSGCDFMSLQKNQSISEQIFNRGLCLPSDTKMSNEDVKLVAGIVNSVLGGCR